MTTTAPYPTADTTTGNVAGAGFLKERGPWAVWFLSFLPFYYLVWYVKINKEMAAVTGEKLSSAGMFLGQCIPIVHWFGLVHTAGRVNRIRAQYGLAPTCDSGMTILSSFWFASQTRYLQRRINATGAEIAAR